MEHMVERFGLKTARDVLSPTFSEVEILSYPDSLWVTEVEPLAAYVESMFSWEERRLAPEDLRRQIEQRIRSEGGYRVNKSSGMVRAVRAGL